MVKKKGFDVTKHKLVPDHEILPEEEVDSLLEDYEIEKYQLPKIQSKDPVAKAIDAESGDVVKISRESPTTGDSVIYRLVI